MSIQAKNFSISNKMELKIKIQSFRVFDDVSHYVTISNLSYNFSKRTVKQSPEIDEEALLDYDDIAEYKLSQPDSLDIHFKDFQTRKKNETMFNTDKKVKSYQYEDLSTSFNNLINSDFINEKNLNLLIEQISIKVNTNVLSRLLFIKNRIVNVFVRLFDPTTPFKQSNLECCYLT